MRVMIRNPDVIILDEPTSSLDMKSRLNLMKYLKSIKKDKIIIIATHDKELADFCDKQVKIPD